MTNALTPYGVEVVDREIRFAEKAADDADRALHDAVTRLAYMRTVKACDHDLEELGGIELVQMRCKKCGFSWFD